MPSSLTINSVDTGAEPLSEARLSRLESRCLLRRLDDCERTMRAALLGIREARDKTRNAAEMIDINAELAQAKLHLNRAYYVAALTSVHKDRSKSPEAFTPSTGNPLP